ncbi:MAG: lipoprotein [Fimbriimonadales bacterium]
MFTYLSEFFWLAVLALVSLLACGCAGAKQDPVVGYWEGTLAVPGGQQLRLGLHVAKLEGGGYSAKLDSLDQGAFGLGVDQFTFESGKVTFEMKTLGAQFEGTMAEDQQSIVGKFRQSGLTMDLTLAKKEKPATSQRPQEPKPPYPYLVEDVQFRNERADILLAGTVTIPRGAGPFPGIVLVSGSGPQDRNEALLGHKPFLVLADHLTRRGIAVLRFDDRGVGKSEGNFATATSEDFVTDAIAAVEFLRTRSGVDPNLVGIAGHSEGGLVAPIAAVRSPNVAFIVLLAGTGVVGEEILYLQAELISRAEGATDQEIAEGRRAQERIFEIVKLDVTPAERERRLQALASELVTSLSERQRKALGGNEEAYIQSQIRMVSSPWFRYFLTYDPAPTLRKVRVPVLAINGELDLQVPAKVNLGAIERALEEGGNRNYEVHELKGLNHLFQTAKTGSPTEYATIQETMSPTAMELIADWVLRLRGTAKTSPQATFRQRPGGR